MSAPHSPVSQGVKSEDTKLPNSNIENLSGTTSPPIPALETEADPQSNSSGASSPPLTSRSLPGSPKSPATAKFLATLTSTFSSPPLKIPDIFSPKRFPLLQFSGSFRPRGGATRYLRKFQHYFFHLLGQERIGSPFALQP